MTENERILRDIIIDGNGTDYDESIPQSIFEEIQQYRAIGTVKEFKVLKEKNEPKNWIAEYIGDGEYVWKCPVCGEDWILMDGTPQDNEYNYCPKCGHAMAESRECCANCRSFYTEYGMEFCKHFDEPMDDVNTEKCSDYERDWQ